MINIDYKKTYIKINHLWFDYKRESKFDKNKFDIIFIHGQKNLKSNYKHQIKSKQYSLISDLTLEIDEIIRKFNKNYRNEINRAKRENIKCEIFTSSDLIKNIDILKKFEKEHEDFTKLKGIKNAYNNLAIKEYIRNNNIILTKSFKDNIDYAQHMYIHDNDNIRLLYSVSNFRTEGLDSKTIGRANKYLHLYDIETFKEKK